MQNKTMKKARSLIWGGEKGWDGWIDIENSWNRSCLERKGDPDPGFVYWESKHESTATLRSPKFKIRSEKLLFYIAGFDMIDTETGDGGCFLKLADDESIVREAAPPQSADFIPREWFVRELKGKEAFFEVKRSRTFAYLNQGLAITGIEEIFLEEAVEGDVFCCMKIPVSSPDDSELALIDCSGIISNIYLSSNRRKENELKIIRSSSFVLSIKKICFRLRGIINCSHANAYTIELVDEKTNEVLEVINGTDCEIPEIPEMDSSAYIGRRVSVRIIDYRHLIDSIWISLDEKNAGPDVSVLFNDREDFDRWMLQTSFPRYTEVYGVPFIKAQSSIVRKNDVFAINIGAATKRLLLCGMKFDRSEYAGRKLGSIKVHYINGKIEIYPLIVGESLWWGKHFYKYPEPFVSHVEAKETLQDALRIYPPRPTPVCEYIACINPNPEIIEKIEIEPEANATCIPVITGVTVIPADNAGMPEDSIQVNCNISEEVRTFINNTHLRQENDNPKLAFEKVDRVRKFIYCLAQDFPKQFTPDIPQGYYGPEVKFAGDQYAEFFTNVFFHNVPDMISKVDENGIYHTSSPGAPWYGYDSMGGTYSLDFKLRPDQGEYGMYYGEAWSRDLGRTLIEMVSLGYFDKARLCADWCFKMAGVWEESTDADLAIDGVKLPRHICRRLQFPGVKIGNGCFENDGHGLTALFIYNLWKRLPDRDIWLHSRWEDVRGLGDWVIWQFDNPEVSRAKEVLWSDSEASGWNNETGHSFFADLACIEALIGLAEMAESAGEQEAAQRWRAAAEKLKTVCESFYIETGEDNIRLWSDKYSGWSGQSVLAPVILPTEIKGLMPENLFPEWDKLNNAVYNLFLHKYMPSVKGTSTALGYGTAFTIQAALLLDRTKDAAILLQNAALLIYGPVFKKFLVPESAICFDSEMQAYARVGDLGNAVQQAEIIKVMKIIIGIDDTMKAALGLIPRLPEGWNEISIKDFPFLIEDEKRREAAKLEYSYKIRGNSATMHIHSSSILPEVLVRTGPFKTDAKRFEVYLDGAFTDSYMEERGDSVWVRFTVSAGQIGFSAVISER